MMELPSLSLQAKVEPVQSLLLLCLDACLGPSGQVSSVTEGGLYFAFLR